MPILIFAGLVGWQFIEAERVRLEGKAREAVRSARAAVDQDLTGLVAVLETLASSPQLIAGDLKAFDAQAREVTQRIGIHIVVRDVAGQQVINTRLPYGVGLPGGLKFDFDERVRASHRSYVSDVFTGAVAQKPLVAINAPVLRGGDVIYLMNLSLPTERFRDILTRENLPDGWVLGVVDRVGTTVARSRQHDDFAGQPFAREIYDRTHGREGAFLTPNLEGEKVLFSYQRSPLTDWLVEVGVPPSQLEAPLWEAVTALSLLGLALGGLGTGATYLIGRRLKRAISDVTTFAEWAGRGDAFLVPSTPLSEANRISEALAASARDLGQRTRELRRSEVRLRRVLDNLFAFVGVLEVGGVLVEVNEAPLRVAGLARADVIGKPFWECHWWSYSPRVQEKLREAVSRAARGETVRYDEEVRIAGGALITIDFQIAPLRDDEGEIVNLVPSGIDVTDRKRGEAANARLAAIVSSTSDAIVSFAAEDGRILTWNKGAEALFGYSPDEALGAPVTLLVSPEHLNEIENETGIFDRAIAEGQVHVESVRRRKDGSLVNVSISAARMTKESGRVLGVSAIFRDITERTRLEVHQRLLIRELHHRIKNTLATVQAIAGTTGRSARSMDEFRTSFADRLVSLGRTHTLLTENAWEGASLEDVLALELGPYRDEAEGRVELHGPRVDLPSDAAVVLGMGIHELTTNSLKYGALSVSAGRVSVSWTRDQDGDQQILRLDWLERGGPPVAEPLRRGFGSQLLQRVLGAQLNGYVEILYRTEGVHARIEARLPHAAERPRVPGVAVGAP